LNIFRINTELKYGGKEFIFIFNHFFLTKGEAPGNSASRALVRRAPAPNNSETSQPSSNDSAIEVEGHEEEQRPPARQWGQRGGNYYFDKRNNRVIEIINLSQNPNQTVDTSQSQSINDSQAHLLVHTMAQSHVHFRSKRNCVRFRLPAAQLHARIPDAQFAAGRRPRWPL